MIICVCPRYSTAYAESDYTDRDTDREEGEREPERESEEEEDKSSATVLTLCQKDVEEVEDEDEDEERGFEEEEEDEGRLQLVTEVPSGELALLLAQSDILHTGDASLKADGFRLLLNNKAEVRNMTHSSHDIKLHVGKLSFTVFTLSISYKLLAP